MEHSSSQQTLDLAARVRAGDVAAFEAPFRAHYGPLCGFAACYVG